VKVCIAVFPSTFWHNSSGIIISPVHQGTSADEKPVAKLAQESETGSVVKFPVTFDSFFHLSNYLRYDFFINFI